MVERLNTESIVGRIEELILNAADASDSQDAMRYSQAACNAANAMVTLANIDTSSDSTAQAFETLKLAIQKDSDLAWTWQCNLAMAYRDSGGSLCKSHEAASRFMSTCFEVDITKSQEWESYSNSKPPIAVPL